MSLTKSQVESIVRNTITEYVSETTVSGKMKAYVMNEERKMVIKEMPEPVPKADNMIVKINYASICGTDFRTFMKGNAKITPPRIMGHESAGVVLHVGGAVIRIFHHKVGSLDRASHLGTAVHDIAERTCPQSP